MIIIRLSGGLGNQLFQYALARSLKDRSGFDVKIDIDFLKSPQEGLTRRDFLLDKFNISIDTPDESDMRKMGAPEFSSSIINKIFKIKEFIVPFLYKKVIYDNNFVFDKRILNLRDSKYLMGNWLSPKYFQDIRDIILGEIILKEELSEEVKKVLNEIKNFNSVSVHIRRGDYLKYPKFGLCPADYYKEAVEYFKKNTANPTFFIFSDDMDYVRKNLYFPENTRYVSDSNIRDYEELVLMSKCSHNIIANSSFSWWGAWLNQNTAKIVVAPKAWRADGKNIDDYVPDELGWIKM